jgi:quinol monooxygenase YgiN/mannose-6-phosphate isomerase-like protein (cupin superfamily)
MPSIARHVKLTAKPGQGDALAELLLEAAAGLKDVPGCELYIVNRVPGDPDAIWVTELWRSQESLDASLESEGATAQISLAQELLAGPPEQLELAPVGGVGYLAGETGFTIANLDEDVEDSAVKYGYSEMGEARFANTALNTLGTGVSLQRLRPDTRQFFAHRHQHAEEVYVVLSGTGRVRIDDTVRDVRPLDAIRVAPGSTRAFEAGPDGLELLAVGGRHTGDAEIVRDFWT